MKDLPNPTFPLSFIAIPPVSAQAALLDIPIARPEALGGSSGAGLSVAWACHLDEVREAQRLRFKVFANEMGAQIATPLPGHDIDHFDPFCEHLLVRDVSTGEVVGTYRVLTPAQARRVGSTYSDLEFDLTRIRSLRDRTVELGRSCVHADYRQGAVIMSLWAALASFMDRNKLDTMIGCASIPMHYQGMKTGAAAASIWHQLKQKHLAPIEHQVHPRLALPLGSFDSTLPVEAPALIKGYLRLGAKIMGPPAWDPDFNSADLPMLLRIEDMAPRYRRHFLGA